MNGRIYDPAIGRMMSADPFAQDPTNGQALNRYAYVINNPLAYTDPNGFFFRGIFRAIGNIVSNPRAVIAIAAAVAVPELGIAGKSLFWNGVIGGAVAGGIAGGDIKSVVTGAVSGGVFAEVGTIAKEAGWANGSFEKAALHAVAGGVTSVIQGGDLKSGFIAAGFTQLAGPHLPDIGKVGNAVSRAVVGGVAAVLGGGKFENGAVTAAFAYLFNDLIHEEKLKITDEQRQLLKEGKTLDFWQSRDAVGDPIAKLGLAFANVGDPRALALAGAALGNLQANAMRVLDRVLTGQEISDLRLALARAHVVATDGDRDGIRGLLSPGQVYDYHTDVFSSLGLPPSAFGGSPLTGTRWEATNIWVRAWCARCDSR